MNGEEEKGKGRKGGKVREDMCRLIGEQGLEEEVYETDLSYDPVTEEQTAVEEEELEEVERQDDKSTARVCGSALDSFETDPAAFYLKEVSSYPLLTREREMELASPSGKAWTVLCGWSRRMLFEKHSSGI